MQRDIRIEYVPLTELRRWPRNPKQHDLGAIHTSVARFGFVNPIIVNEATGLILAGHGRLDTLQQRKASGEPLPQGLRSENGQWLVPVVRGVSLPTEEAEAYAVADNRTVELGGWDEARLAEVLSDLASMPEGLDGVGFDGDDIDALLNELDKDMTFSSGMTPSQGGIDEREEELRRRFEERERNFLNTLVEILCPECGADFKVRRVDLLKKTTT